MKVIKKGENPEQKIFKVNCHKCGSVLEYVRKDAVSDQRYGDYVVCPICKSFINHNP